MGRLFVINPNKRLHLKDIEKFLAFETNNYGEAKKENQDTLDSDNGSEESKSSPRLSFEMEEV